jgi:hypothetical protein
MMQNAERITEIAAADEREPFELEGKGDQQQNAEDALDGELRRRAASSPMHPLPQGQGVERACPVC